MRSCSTSASKGDVAAIEPKSAVRKAVHVPVTGGVNTLKGKILDEHSRASRGTRDLAICIRILSGTGPARIHSILRGSASIELHRGTTRTDGGTHRPVPGCAGD